MENMDILSKSHIHFVGICGISMSSLAILARGFGIKVSGSDAKYDTIVDNLRAKDIEILLVNNGVITFELLVDKSVLSDVEEWLGIENVNEIKGKHLAFAKLPYDKGLVSKIMSFGSKVKVLSPKVLIDDVKANAVDILKNY